MATLSPFKLQHSQTIKTIVTIAECCKNAGIRTGERLFGCTSFLFSFGLHKTALTEKGTGTVKVLCYIAAKMFQFIV